MILFLLTTSFIPESVDLNYAFDSVLSELYSRKESTLPVEFVFSGNGLQISSDNYKSFAVWLDTDLPNSNDREKFAFPKNMLKRIATKELRLGQVDPDQLVIVSFGYSQERAEIKNLTEDMTSEHHILNGWTHYELDGCSANIPNEQNGIIFKSFQLNGLKHFLDLTTLEPEFIYETSGALMNKKEAIWKDTIKMHETCQSEPRCENIHESSNILAVYSKNSADVFTDDLKQRFGKFFSALTLVAVDFKVLEKEMERLICEADPEPKFIILASDDEAVPSHFGQFAVRKSELVVELADSNDDIYAEYDFEDARRTSDSSFYYYKRKRRSTQESVDPVCKILSQDEQSFSEFCIVPTTTTIKPTTPTTTMTTTAKTTTGNTTTTTTTISKESDSTTVSETSDVTITSTTASTTTTIKTTSETRTTTSSTIETTTNTTKNTTTVVVTTPQERKSF